VLHAAHLKGKQRREPGSPIRRSPIRWRKISVPRWAELVPAYAIGGVAAFWVVERVATF